MAPSVSVGSDYPYDIGMLDCVRHVRSLDIPAADRDTILGEHAEAILRGARAACADRAVAIDDFAPSVRLAELASKRENR